MEDPKRIVRQGYDQLGEAYRAFYEKADSMRYSHWLTRFVQLLGPESNVLELGCADGIPTARYLSQYVDYVGIDISPVQIALARRNVHQARFEVADMTDLHFPDESFMGIVALYSIVHVPLSEQLTLFQALHRWLKTDGYLLCVVGADHWTGTEEDWIRPGTAMYWSHADAATYTSWFIQLGFTILENQFIPEGKGGHTFFIVKK